MSTWLKAPQHLAEDSVCAMRRMLLQPMHEQLQYTNDELIAIGDEVRAMMMGERFVDKEALLQRVDELNVYRWALVTFGSG